MYTCHALTDLELSAKRWNFVNTTCHQTRTSHARVGGKNSHLACILLRLAGRQTVLASFVARFLWSSPHPSHALVCNSHPLVVAAIHDEIHVGEFERLTVKKGIRPCERLELARPSPREWAQIFSFFYVSCNVDPTTFK